jgi:hypothetical protein
MLSNMLFNYTKRYESMFLSPRANILKIVVKRKPPKPYCPK